VRILAISNMYPPHHYGGYELSCRDVMERFEDNGHDVTVLTTTMRVPGVADPPGEDPTRIRRELDFYWRDHVLQSPTLPRRIRVERANQQALARAMREVRPDVVSVWNMGAMSLGLLTTLVGGSVPLVYNVCDDWLDYGPHLDAWTRLFATRPRLGALIARATRVPTTVPELGSTGTFCFVSERTRRHAKERTGAQFPRSTIVYSGIDGRDFPPRAVRTALAWSWRLLFVGRIDERKGIETLVRALPLLPADATVDLVGQGDAEEINRLRAIAAELGVANRVSFGSCDRSELRDRYVAVDAVVFPSTWDEPFGLVPVEAMACSTPVVASGTGGSAEFLVDGVNCVLFRVGDEVALAEALVRLADDSELRRSLVEGGLATAADLTIDRLAQTLEAWHHAAATGFAEGEPPHRPGPGRG
jgi:glycogen synthase